MHNDNLLDVSFQKVHFVVVSVGPDGFLPAENLDSVQGVIGNVNNGGKVPESPSASDVGGKSQVQSMFHLPCRKESDLEPINATLDSYAAHMGGFLT